MASQPRFLRFVARLAWLGTGTALGCASSVNTADVTANDTSTSDTAAQSEAGAPVCPATTPFASGECTRESQRCSYPNHTCDGAQFTVECACERRSDPPGLGWSCFLCEGPIPPPDLPV